MGLSVATFKAHPRFRVYAALEDADVATVLADALEQVDADVAGAQADQLQGLLAAHMLAMSPHGQAAGLRAGGGANQTSVFWSDYEDLRKRLGTAYRVIVHDPELPE